ncbi:hypothetical protein PHPALM_31471 [Phytophthora palmivora]|uniref:Uncharacterized protein n=1 Tax=Phytophthora palmivora TaxID=4796 RepID=A0A2P4X2H8_9STRA|nr:hypothetical protein PHPALM_31471 [Phytophthora palmivora]
MQPEAQKPLDIVEKEARARYAQLDSEDTIQGAHHVSLDEVTEDDQKESAPASVGGAVVVECPAEEALVKPRPDEGVISVDDDAEEKIIPDETPTIRFVDQGKTYVADQVRRWEQVTLEFVMSPLSEAWISKWNLVRLAPNAVVDFTSVEVYLKDLSPRECVAALQTMFFDVGFRFRILIPEWFRAHASQVDRSLVRAVAKDLQHLLTMEILEWREVTSGVPSRMLSPLDERALTDTVEDMKPEDAEARAEGAHNVLESAQVEFEERWQQREAKVEAEKVAWVADVQKTLNAQLESFQQKIHSLEEARNRDQETIRDLQNVQGMRSRNTPATHHQVQDTRATYGSDPATQVESEPTRVTMYPLPGNAIKGHASERRDIKCDSDLPAEQLRLTLQSLTGTKYVKGDETVKSELTPGVKSSSVSLSIRVSMETAQGLVLVESQVTKDTAQATLVQDFDEKLSLSARRRWRERFLNATVQGGWTDQMKVYELKTKMSPASEKYYTMKQFKDETALAFLYRLNLAAERADSQRFRKVSDLEYVLKQQEEVNPSGAHSAQDDEAQGSDTQATFEDDERADLAALSTCVQDVLRDGNPDARLLTRVDLIHEVYRVMNSVGGMDIQLKEIKKLLRQGGLADLPNHIREDILNDKGDSEGAQLNY